MEFPTPMRYKDYELEHFLVDEFFIQWVKCPDENNRHFWEKWLREHPEKRIIVQEAARLIRAVRYGKTIPVTDTVYVETFENIVRAAGSLEAVKSGGGAVSHILGLLTLRKLVAVLVLGFFGWLSLDIMFQPRRETAEPLVEIPIVTKENPAGKKSIVTLTDGSKVYLNAGSAIWYPKEFGSDKREVTLTGEAFFDVHPESDRPFVVRSGNVRVEVLGTSFNVNQQEGGKLAIALVTGKVRVKDEQGSQVHLEPSEMLVMEEGGAFYKTAFDPLEVLGWKDKQLVFKMDNMESAKRKIENWYGVEVQVKGAIPRGWAYTGVYQDELLENVLRGIFHTSGISYKIDGKQVTIYNPN
ncbi:FecR family protein [Lunatimonas salinarum]|uniref:FecR family protein n=1 Tax=Lunatimonas salinarum TaxID=1774590 RepID=UPI001FD79901|nr:FecR family protein [Lunatimonas salinarum]